MKTDTISLSVSKFTIYTYHQFLATRSLLLLLNHHSLRNVETRIIGGITESGIVARETKWRETRYTHAYLLLADHPKRDFAASASSAADDHCSRT